MARAVVLTVLLRICGGVIIARPHEADIAFAFPPVLRAKAIFEGKWKAEPSLQEPLPQGVQLVLGVFATQSLSEAVLTVHRSTWMQRQGVCSLHPGPRPNCSVYVAFVFGDKPWNGTEAADDKLFLNTTENMNDGKSFEFFAHAARTYGWATHIGKMDLDAFPHVLALTTSLLQEPRSKCDLYFGTAMDFDRCWGHAWCPPKKCGLPRNRDFSHYASKDKACWSYMQGGLYLMSTHLALAASGPGSWWSENPKGVEDLTAGRGVAAYMRRTGQCVRTWDNPKAFDHLPTLQFHVLR